MSAPYTFRYRRVRAMVWESSLGGWRYRVEGLPPSLPQASRYAAVAGAKAKIRGQVALAKRIADNEA